MGWNSRMRASRSSYNFRKNGSYRPGSSSDFHISLVNKESDDYMNRQRVLDEIKTRCEKNNEKLDNVVDEIVKRKEIKEQFDYFTKNGITDIASIFKNWYNGYRKNKGKKTNIVIR